MENHKSAEDYVQSNPNWLSLLSRLREILLSTELEETIKWGIPTYTINNKNVVGLAAFKEHVAIWFFNGVFLQDEKKVLINAQAGTTKGLRQWRFNRSAEIETDLVKAYLEEAIENQKKGLVVKPEKKSLHIPVELEAKLNDNPQLKICFDRFTQSKKREFAEYILNAKRAETKLKRLEKITPLILQQVGLHDKYKN